MRYLTTFEPFELASTAFDRLWSGLDHDARARAATFSPPADVLESSDAYTIELELPGVDPKTVDVTLLDDVLTISGAKPDRPAPSEGDRTWATERRSGSFERKFRFPVAVDADSVTAHTAHGVLTLRVAKAPEAKPRRIQIDNV